MINIYSLLSFSAIMKYQVLRFELVDARYYLHIFCIACMHLDRSGYTSWRDVDRAAAPSYIAFHSLEHCRWSQAATRGTC